MMTNVHSPRVAPASNAIGENMISNAAGIIEPRNKSVAGISTHRAIFFRRTAIDAFIGLAYLMSVRKTRQNVSHDRTDRPRVAKRTIGATAVVAKRLHPKLARWFHNTYGEFTQAQLLAIPSILKRESILLTSPTGSGKTLAAFLGIFHSLLRRLDDGQLTRGVQCIYVSPLRALAYDIGK